MRIDRSHIAALTCHVHLRLFLAERIRRRAIQTCGFGRGDLRSGFPLKLHLERQQIAVGRIGGERFGKDFKGLGLLSMRLIPVRQIAGRLGVSREG